MGLSIQLCLQTLPPPQSASAIDSHNVQRLLHGMFGGDLQYEIYYIAVTNRCPCIQFLFVCFIVKRTVLQPFDVVSRYLSVLNTSCTYNTRDLQNVKFSSPIQCKNKINHLKAFAIVQLFPSLINCVSLIISEIPTYLNDEAVYTVSYVRTTSTNRYSRFDLKRRAGNKTSVRQDVFFVLIWRMLKSDMFPKAISDIIGEWYIVLYYWLLCLPRSTQFYYRYDIIFQ